MGCLCPKKPKNKLLDEDFDPNGDEESNYNTKKKENKKGNANMLESENIKIDKKRKNIIDKEKYKDITYDKEFAKKALDKNNEYRKNHGVKNLQLDEYLCLRASILAKPISLDETYDNENLLYENGDECGMLKDESEEQLSPENLMENWYGQIKKYDFNEPKDYECDKFTQMVWKNTKKFGIAYYCLTNILTRDSDAQDEEIDQKPKKYYYVALYYPPGNKPEEYKDNVLKRKNSDAKKVEMANEEGNIKNEA